MHTYIQTKSIVEPGIVCVHVCMCSCMYMCMYVYIWIFVYIDIVSVNVNMRRLVSIYAGTNKKSDAMNASVPLPHLTTLIKENNVPKQRACGQARHNDSKICRCLPSL